METKNSAADFGFEKITLGKSSVILQKNTLKTGLSPQSGMVFIEKYGIFPA
jgi:hypothetical protein